jgi:hypothetical protein
LFLPVPAVKQKERADFWIFLYENGWRRFHAGVCAIFGSIAAPLKIL